jgi:hypothetical protein
MNLPYCDITLRCKLGWEDLETHRTSQSPRPTTYDMYLKLLNTVCEFEI